MYPFEQGIHSVLEWCFPKPEMPGLRKENLTFREVEIMKTSKSMKNDRAPPWHGRDGGSSRNP